MFGSHLSVAGGMDLAVREAVRLGLDCVQVFTKNQRQWAAPPLSSETIKNWRAALKEVGWDKPGPARVTSHASYLINLGAAPGDLRDKSLALMREEIDRCEALAIPLLVFHPGAFTTTTRPEGIDRIVEACTSLLNATRGYRTVLCLENVVGAGSHIGNTFEELALMRARIIGATGQPERIAYCIDTCHAHAAGYDCSTRAKAEAIIRQIKDTLDLAAVRCMHFNDSIGAMGSRKDRHEHIGEGTIGLAGFAAFVNEPAFANIPKILETEKSEPGAPLSFDQINVARLRAMVGITALPKLVPINAPATAATPPSAPKPKAKAKTSPTPKPASKAPPKPAAKKKTAKSPAPGKPAKPARKSPMDSKPKRG